MADAPHIEAFRQASEQAMKDLVALEFSRAATQGMPTGFISGRADARSEVSPQLLSVGARQASSPNPPPQ